MITQATNHEKDLFYSLNDLGFLKSQVDAIEAMKRHPHGLNILSGPTGSGRSVTLRSIFRSFYDKRYPLHWLDEMDLVYTDHRTDGIRKGIRAVSGMPARVFLRLVNSFSTALAFEGALLGHQIWVEAPGVDPVSVLRSFRLRGVDDDRLTDPSLVTGLMDQQLVRILCSNCSLTYVQALEQNRDELSDFLPLSSYREIFGDDVVEPMRFVNTDGCDSTGCRGGWSGRKVVANCIQPDERFMEIVRQGLLKQARLYWQREMGGISMQEHTAARVLAGQVDLRDAVNYVPDVDSMEKDRVEVVREISREV